MPAMPSTFAAMRTRIRRRILEALKGALKEMGYDKQGRSLVEGKQGLTGTLEIAIHDRSVLTESKMQLKANARLVIKQLEKQSAQSKTLYSHRFIKRR